MKYYILTYETVDNFIEARQAYRPEHLSLVKEYFADGLLVMGGALDNPANEALLIFKSDSPASIELFVKNDPYVQNGLILKWKIRTWTVAIGGDIKN